MQTATDTNNFLSDLNVLYRNISLPVQLTLVATCYVPGVFFVDHVQWNMYLGQLLNVILLFSATSLYGHFHDDVRLNGSPVHTRVWMRSLSLWTQFGGLLLAHNAGMEFTYLYLITMILLWLRSTPRVRWKAYPWRGILVYSFAIGFSGFLMGFYAAGGINAAFPVFVAATGIAVLAGALLTGYQLTRVDDDRSRADRTFAVELGLYGVSRSIGYGLPLGIFLIVAGFLLLDLWVVGIAFAAASSGVIVQLRRVLQSDPETGILYRTLLVCHGAMGMVFVVLVLVWQAYYTVN